MFCVETKIVVSPSVPLCCCFWLKLLLDKEWYLYVNVNIGSHSRKLICIRWGKECIVYHKLLLRIVTIITEVYYQQLRLEIAIQRRLRKYH